MRNPAVFIETAGLSALPTPTGLFLPSQHPLSESPKLPALRAVVFAKVRARHLGFLLLRRLRLFPPPKTVRRRFPSALAIPATPPHVGATSDFPAPCGYALGYARKVAQTADTGATARNTLSVTSASPSRAVHTSFPCPPAGRGRCASGHPRKFPFPDMPLLPHPPQPSSRRLSSRP